MCRSTWPRGVVEAHLRQVITPESTSCVVHIQAWLIMSFTQRETFSRCLVAYTLYLTCFWAKRYISGVIFGAALRSLSFSHHLPLTLVLNCTIAEIISELSLNLFELCGLRFFPPPISAWGFQGQSGRLGFKLVFCLIVSWASCLLGDLPACVTGCRIGVRCYFAQYWCLCACVWTITQHRLTEVIKVGCSPVWLLSSLMLALQLDWRVQ